MPRNHAKAFTLAELLIALSILGVIATFTIPKVLQSQQNSKDLAIAKETVASVSSAYMAYKVKNQPATGFSVVDLGSYLNYVKLLTTGAVDSVYGGTGSLSCNSGCPCYLLHNGAMLHACMEGFGDTSATAATPFHIDPDGIVTDSVTTNGPGKTIGFFLYINGRVVDEGHVVPAAYTTSWTYSNNPSAVPPWFNWN